MKLGDFIFYITKYTGIKWLVDWYSKKNQQRFRYKLWG